MILVDRKRDSDSAFQEKWDAFVQAFSGTTFYHLYGWKKVLAKTFDFRPYYLMYVNGKKEVDGILPLFLMKNVSGGRFLVSNPFANFAGLSVRTEAAAGKLLQAAKSLAQRLNAHYVEFRHLGKAVAADLPTKTSFVTLYLDLAHDVESAWKRLSSRNRGKIRKAERAGVQLFIGKEYLDDFYCVYVENITRLGTPVFPKIFFANLLKEFPEETELIVLKHRGRPISGMFLFRFKDIIAEPWVSTLRAYGKIYANNYLYWKAIEYAIRGGFKTFDFGRSTVDTGTYHYKQQWGARPVPLYYQYFLHRAKNIPQVDAKENKYQFAIDLWKRIPTKVAIHIGPHLVRYLPEL